MVNIEILEDCLIIASSSDIITKIISLILFIKRFYYILKDVKNKSILSFTYNSLKQENENNNWSKTSKFKLTINIILTIFSFLIGIIPHIYYFTYGFKSEECFCGNCVLYINMILIYFSFEGLMWLLSSILFYKETNYYRNQSWNGLRFFWFSNGIFVFIKIATFIIIYGKNYNTVFSYIINILLCLHFFLSIILLYYAIFRPYDFTYRNIEPLINDEDTNNELNSISVDNSLLDLNDDIDIDKKNDNDKDNDDNDNNFDSKDDILYSINIKNNDNKKPITIFLFIKIKTNEFRIFSFTVKLKEGKYKKEKSPSELCDFFKKLIKCYKSKKYPNNIINLIQQSYNVSLTLNPERNSYTGKKDSIKALTHLCNEIVKLSNNFLLDLLLFLDLSNIDLVHILQNNNIESSLDDFDNEDDDSIFEISHTNTKKSNLSSSSIYKNTSFRSISSLEQMSRDVIKLYTFFNNIMIKDNCISVKIIKYDEEKSEIECLLKTINPIKEVSININSENLLDALYNDELKTYYIDNINTMIEENDYSIFELLLNDYLNDLIYYDDNLFIQLQLNKILNLDIEKFNENILINFFENNNIECINNISNILFDIILHPLDEKISIDNYLFSIKYTLKGIDKKNILNDNNKEVNMDLNIIKLYIIIDNILPVINSFLKKNFNELYSSLGEIKIYIENYLGLFFDINAEQFKKLKIKSENEINKAKYQKLLFGEKRINEFSSSIINKLIKYKKDIDNFEDKNIEKINGKIKEINKTLNSILNNSNLKYVLFFSEMRKILGISQLI